MGRCTSVSAVVLTVLLAAGCSAESGSSDGASSKPNRPSGGASSESSKKSDGSKALRLPNHPNFLVKVRAGAGTQPLPDFTPSKDVYTVHVKCSKAKNLKIVFRNSPKDDPTTVKCDVPVTVGQIYTDPGKQKLAINAADGARWTLAIVDGKYAI
ncbi:hypothetical protein ABT039_09415 [Streptomyces lasiicapitis]|uniref:hypothetical protein n=1 Tax=Streptomyces lasiicapitis TaxID=1923961 RepID=UPI003317CED0